MSDPENTSVAREIWELSKRIPAIRRALESLSESERREKILSLYNEDFIKLDEDTTDVLNYIDWLNNSDTWPSKSGEMWGTSFDEHELIWSDPTFYSLYEANLLKYKKNGIFIDRTIVIGKELFNENLLSMIIRTGYRQSLLGLPPMIVHKNDFANMKGELGVDCHMFGVIGGEVATFIRNDPHFPSVVKTTHNKYIEKASLVYWSLHNKAIKFEDWIRKINTEIEIDMESIEKECERIEFYSNYNDA